MDYLPIFFSLSGKTVLLTGNGAPVADKLALVRRAGARVLLLATAPGAELRAVIQGDCQVAWEQRAFAPDDVNGKALVIALLDDAGNRLIAAVARMRSVPVNIIDRPDLSSVIMPAIVDYSPVVIAVGTSGAAPALAARLRRQIEALLPLNLGRLAEFARDRRPQVAHVLSSHDQRRRFWRRWFDGPGAAALLAGREAEAHDSLTRDLAAIDPCPLLSPPNKERPRHGENADNPAALRDHRQPPA